MILKLVIWLMLLDFARGYMPIKLKQHFLKCRTIRRAPSEFIVIVTHCKRLKCALRGLLILLRQRGSALSGAQRVADGQETPTAHQAVAQCRCSHIDG